MLTKLAGGKVYDPAHGQDGVVRDIFIRGGRIVDGPGGDTPDKVYDLTGRIVMAGAIDMHTHIGGGKVTIARTLLPEDHRGDPAPRHGLMRGGCGH
ncbi:MAG: amidohydrolase family protein, partial [Gammaproteobacteria bacterium]|nr:amidohydrolase family protein [Gammaproteobacteria bacterium]